jgi:hypothetical protein
MKLMIGMPIGDRKLPWETAESLIETMRKLERYEYDVALQTEVGCPIVQWARSLIAHEFLQSDCDTLVWIDSDTVWTFGGFMRLIDHLRDGYPIVAGAVPQKTIEPLFVINDNDQRIGDLVGIDSIGLAFVAMRRDVVEAVAAKAPRMERPRGDGKIADIFRVGPGKRGEDIGFFDEARALGFNAWLDPTIELGHVGSHVYRADVPTL